jgi:sugar transferase (PEP-CTERM/EpsH1 system associated)
MKILYIAHRIPYPPNKGEKIRAFHQIQYLSRIHEVYLTCLVDEKKDLPSVKVLEKYCTSVDAVYRDKLVSRVLALFALFTNKPLSVASFYSRALARKIARRLRSERFDRIFVSCSAMTEYVRHVSDIPKVVDFVDVDSEKWRLYADYRPFPLSWIYRLEAKRLARYEEEIVQGFDHSLFISDREVALFQQRVKNRPISFIGNGVRLDYFSPQDKSCADQPFIVFTGVMDYFPNIDAARYFCEEVFPLIRGALPDAHFYIVGRNPSWQVGKLGCQPQVTVTGAVPDIRPYLKKAMIAVVPLRIAGGVQNKILEAMAMGLPVVGTSKAFQGIHATVTDGIRIADEPKEFARQVLMLLKDPRLRRQCSLQARRYVERYHCWEDYGAHLDQLLRKVNRDSKLATFAQVRPACASL